MPVIINKILPIGKDFFAINLCGIIFSKGKCDKIVLNHEKIHTRQMLELFILPFYLIYILEWGVRMLKFHDRFLAYKNISFEREAYINQNNLNYLRQRKLYSFIRYLQW